MQNLKVSKIYVPIPAAKATIRRKIASLKNFYKNEHTPLSDPVGQTVAFGSKTKVIHHLRSGATPNLKMSHEVHWTPPLLDQFWPKATKVHM